MKIIYETKKHSRIRIIIGMQYNSKNKYANECIQKLRQSTYSKTLSFVCIYLNSKYENKIKNHLFLIKSDKYPVQKLQTIIIYILYSK